jgi:hypothetical protein
LGLKLYLGLEVHMAAIRKHWKLAVLNVLLIVGMLGILTWYMVRSGSPVATAQSVSSGWSSGTASPPANSPTPTDPIVYARIETLRQRIALSNMDLAAMGCSQAQASSVFSTLLTWYQANQGTWSQAEQNETSARNDLQETWRLINVGPKDDNVLSQLPTKQQNITTAVSARQQVEQTAANAVAGVLTSSQNTLWMTIQANAAVPDVYRFAPSLSAQQVTQIQASLAKGQVVPTDTLTASQWSVIQSVIAAQNQTANGVAAAEQTVLPAPAIASGNP